MKLYHTVLLALAGTFAAQAEAKNVANLKFDPLDVAALEQEAQQLEKRDAKNVVDLNFVVDDSRLLTKRDAKNVANINIVIDENELAGKKKQKKQKRDAKNVVNLNFVVDDDELKRHLAKRDAKNVVDLHNLVIDESDLETRKVKRDGMDYTEMVMKVPATGDNDGNDEDALYQMVVDIPAEVIEKLSDGYNELKLKVKGALAAAQDVSGKMKFTVMPEVAGSNLATALDKEADVSIFSSYVRDLIDVYRMFKDSSSFNINSADEEGKMLLVFAPTNDAMLDLESKPWQFPESPVEGQNEEAVINRNVRHFVESHVAQVASNSFNSGKAVSLETLNGKKLELKNTDSGFEVRTHDDDSSEWTAVERIEVLSNGALLTINKSLSTAQKQ